MPATNRVEIVAVTLLVNLSLLGLRPVTLLRTCASDTCAHRLQPSFKAAELLESVGLLWRLGLRFAGMLLQVAC